MGAIFDPKLFSITIAYESAIVSIHQGSLMLKSELYEAKLPANIEFVLQLTQSHPCVTALTVVLIRASASIVRFRRTVQVMSRAHNDEKSEDNNISE